MPGFIEEVRVADLIFAGPIAEITAFTFSLISFSLNDFFPTTRCMMGAFGSVLKFIPPFDNLSIVFSGSCVTVPALGFGIRPFGPKTLATLASFGIISGFATKTSKSILPFSISSRSLSSAIFILRVLPLP